MFIVGDKTTAVIIRFHAGNNLEDDDADSFASSIEFTQSHVETTNVDTFHGPQQEMPNSDEQSDQE